jgi:2-oxoglutarate ferredoxin oxidoreductase subunit alpha
VKYAIAGLRADGHRIGYLRPITLWPFPSAAVAKAVSGASVRRCGSFELSAGQMIDDVRIAVAGRCPVEFVGGVSTDHSGFGVGRILDVAEISARILALHEGRDQPPVPGASDFEYAILPHQLDPTRDPDPADQHDGGVVVP